MPKWMSFIALILVFGGSLIRPTDAVAQDSLSLGALAGFDGYYKVNTWVPVHVVVANEGQDIAGQIEVSIPGDRQGETVYTQPALLPTRSRKQFTLYARLEGYVRELDVRLVQEGKVLAGHTVPLQPLAANELLYGVVSTDPSALTYLAGLPQTGLGRVHVAHLNLPELPAQGRALNSLDVLIVHDVDTGPMSDDQRDALWGWVLSGGHLVACGGPAAVPVAAGLEDLLPVRLKGTETTTQIGTLGDLANAPFIVGQPAVVALVEPTAGRVLAGMHDLPLVVRRQVALGQIDYLAFDPDLEPVRTWIGNQAMWTKLLGSSPRSDVLPQGYNIGRALANIPSLDVLPVLLVMAFLFAYIVIVGPLNFLVLKLVDRRALAWITVPVLILLFSCVAYVAGSVSRGRKAIVSQVSIVRAYPEGGAADVDSFVGLYSPVRRGYDIRLPDGTLVYRLPGGGSVGPGAESREKLIAELGPPTYVRGFEVDVGAMRSFAAYTTQPWPALRIELSSRPGTGNAYRVEGTIANQGSADIQDCVLVWNDEPIQIADLPAGQAQRIDVEFASSAPNYRFIDALLGSTPAGIGANREQERRREILQGLFAAPPYPGSPSLAGGGQLSNLTLIGWLSESPLPVRVEDALTEVDATTLLIAPLTAPTADPGTVFLPKRSFSWQYSGTGTQQSPYSLYNDQDEAEFTFQLPDAAYRVEELFLHLDALNASPYGSPPPVEVEEPGSGTWTPLGALDWGRNPLPDPQRYVAADGTIVLRLSRRAITNPLAIDLSAIVRE